MTTDSQPEGGSNTLDVDSPNYWIDRCRGTPLSIVVPPYIRFLQGLLVLRNALVLLKSVRTVALADHHGLAGPFKVLEESKDTKRLGLTYETFFASHLMINLVSEVEHFLGSAVSAVLRMYPEKMGAQTFKLADIISAGSTDELVDRAARAVLNEMMYEKPAAYITRLSSILSIDAIPLADDWRGFVELKARRDVGVHNNWFVNEIYLRKLKEAGVETALNIGDRVIPDFRYMNWATDMCQHLVETTANLLGEKWLPLLEKK